MVSDMVLGRGDARDDAVCFEQAKVLGENFVLDAGQRALELAKAGVLMSKRVNDRDRPTLRQQTDGERRLGAHVHAREGVVLWRGGIVRANHRLDQTVPV